MLLMLLQEHELGDLLEQISRRIFGNLGQIAAIVFVFGLPLLESLRRKAREKKSRGGAQPPAPGTSRPSRPSVPSPSREQAEREAHGRNVWEALLRGEQPPEPPSAPSRAPAPTPAAMPVPTSVHRVPPRHQPAPEPAPALRPVLTSSRPFPPVDEEALAQQVLERDLARGKAMREESAALASVAAAAAVPTARRAAGTARSALQRVSARELVLASEMLAAPVSLRAVDAGGSLPPGLAAW